MGRTFIIVILAGAGFQVACDDEADLAFSDDEVCFVRRDGANVCIETYEASREDATATDPGVSGGLPRSSPGRLPWTNLTWEAALGLCQAKGRRLCDRDEWVDGCDGGIGETEGFTYPYGDQQNNDLCNVRTGGVLASGASEGCESPLGTFDQGGNVWEWTGNTRGAASARGGAFRSTNFHECKSILMNINIDVPNEEIGFRCCRDS